MHHQLDELDHWVDLASERLGGAVIYANDDFFAEKENLLKPSAPIFIEGKYTDRGKWMDGWETRRRRTPGHDDCIVRLGAAGAVHALVIDTAHFKGNFPESASVEITTASPNATVEELLAAEWTEILGRTLLRGDAKNLFAVEHAPRATHLRLHIYPDGGVARLGVYGEVVADPAWLGREGQVVDLAAVEYGGCVIACNDMFFGSRHNLIMPGRSVNMGDGWETKRSRKEAPDWLLLRLAAEGVVEMIEVDTNHFKGNFPESCAIEGKIAKSNATRGELLENEDTWRPILHRTKLQGHTRHFFSKELDARGPFTHLRLRIFPDGGISRLRVHGIATENGRAHTVLSALNSLSEAALQAALLTCCGSYKWVHAMIKSRPYESLYSLQKKSEHAFGKLKNEDWLEAFRAHPRIGETRAAKATGHQAASWAAGEQARMADADDKTLEAIARVNEAYEKKFGHIYIVCAMGKSSVELLQIAEERLKNDPDDELSRAAEEQKKITALRLEKLVHKKG